jgi:hypothetical protein
MRNHSWNFKLLLASHQPGSRAAPSRTLRAIIRPQADKLPQVLNGLRSQYFFICR